MCRLAAYLGPTRPLADVVITPNHSLVAQSQDALEAKLSVNGDGFGIAWYGRLPEPGLYKDVLPAWSDQNLLSLCQHISAPIFLAHVRASTEAETARANCHPFHHGGWSFMHNGQMGAFPMLRRRLEATLSDALYAARTGTTDSELLFLLLLNAGLAEDPAHACCQVIAQLGHTAEQAGVRAVFRLTCVFSDGERLFAFRHASDGRVPTLYQSHSLGGLTLASEPLTAQTEEWSALAPDHLHVFGPGPDLTSVDLRAA